jgi:hypothetical protein
MRNKVHNKYDLGGCSVGITDGMDLWITPLR